MTDTGTAPSRRRENTRQRLLDAAAEVFAEVGLDAASVEAVCERAGFTRGAFYSNFDTKEELFLELASRVAAERIDAVRARVAHLHDEGTLGVTPEAAPQLVREVLDASPEDRSGVLLMSEIRIRALRNPDLAGAFLAQDAEMLRSVAHIVADIARVQRIELRLSPEESARIMLHAWEGTAARGVMAGLDADELQRRLNEQISVIVSLLISEQR